MIINQQDYIYAQQIPEILKDSGEIGEFELGNLKINIIQLNTYEKDLIKREWKQTTSIPFNELNGV